ncbi:Peptidase M16C associated [Musa troglodytarum]|uniref:Peptidase M16C associated n=1 Tax=Musa troglodytarum TaxID=320322 RepID=A0A9E7KX50_9LILI|nr:Peptidase M16C associated [Musa troglodytarum]
MERGRESGPSIGDRGCGGNDAMSGLVLGPVCWPDPSLLPSTVCAVPSIPATDNMAKGDKQNENIRVRSPLGTSVLLGWALLQPSWQESLPPCWVNSPPCWVNSPMHVDRDDSNSLCLLVFTKFPVLQQPQPHQPASEEEMEMHDASLGGGFEVPLNTPLPSFKLKLKL